MRTSAGIIALDEVPDDLADCDGSCAPGGGLCCPEDSLDAVLRSFAAHDDGFLEALGISAPTSPPPPPAPRGPGWEDGEGAGGVDADGDAWMLLEGTAPGCGGGGQGEPGMGGGLPRAVPEVDEAAFDVDEFFAGNTPDDAGCGAGAQANVCHDGTSCHAVVTPASPARGLADGLAVSDDALLTLAAHDTPPAGALMTTSAAMLARGSYARCAPGGALLPLPAHDAPPARPLTTAPAILPPRGPDARGAPGGLGAYDGTPLLLPAHHALPVGPLTTTSAAMPLRGPEARRAPSSLSVSDGVLPPLPIHNAPPARPFTTTSATASSGSLSSTMTCDTDSPAPVYPPRSWGKRRPRRRGAAVRRNQSWHPNFLPSLAGATPRVSSNHNASIISRQRPTARQRNRLAQRECSHCGNTKTPQWRAGPDGPGTLCNACGIRFTAKKLLPEYRPSTSPSFNSGEHSNRHRKVVKLREKKEKEKIMKMMANVVPAPPNGGEFMDVCTYISTG